MKKSGHEAVVVAEYRLLHALANDKEYRLDNRIHEDLFIHETAKSIYQAIERLDREETPITKTSLYQRANEIDYTVNKQVIETIYDIDTDVAASLTDILSTLDTARKKKDLQEELQALLRVANTGGPLDEDSILQGLFKIDSLLKLDLMASPLQTFDKWSDAYIAELKARASGKRYIYGDPQLDNLIYKGAYPGAITTLAAGTGQGKSTYVLNLISSLLDLYIPCMYISLEMSGIDTYDRLIALRQGISIRDLHTYDSSLEGIIPLVQQEKEALAQNNSFYFVDEPSLSIARIRSLIKEFKQRSGNDYAIVAIDLITQVTDFMHGKSGHSVANAMETAMNDLNALAKEQNVHIIAVVQFNRGADNYKVLCLEDLELLRPSLNNIKNSAAIAERSRVVLSLFRKKYYSDRYLQHIPEAAELEDILEVNILKNSSGPVGHTIKYLFDGEHFRTVPIQDDQVEALSTLELDY